VAYSFIFPDLKNNIHFKTINNMQTRKTGAAMHNGEKKKSYGPGEKKMTKGENLFHDLLIDGLKDMYWAEKHLVKNLPKLSKAATTDALKNSINEHFHETEEQVKKLERVFELIGEKPQAKKCDAMEGLVSEAASIIEETEKETYTRDAGLIMAAQKVEHYEIATYGSLKEFAKTMGHADVVSILEEILEEEKNADLKLNELAIESVNDMARGEWTEEMHQH
jgi:ferritin-like metal-binding protein YciE